MTLSSGLHTVWHSFQEAFQELVGILRLLLPGDVSQVTRVQSVPWMRSGYKRALHCAHAMQRNAVLQCTLKQTQCTWNVAPRLPLCTHPEQRKSERRDREVGLYRHAYVHARTHTYATAWMHAKRHTPACTAKRAHTCTDTYLHMCVPSTTYVSTHMNTLRLRR